jgi:hypothetical protein
MAALIVSVTPSVPSAFFASARRWSSMFTVVLAIPASFTRRGCDVMIAAYQPIMHHYQIDVISAA